MKLTYDPEKSAANVSKHGISLACAEQIDWSAVWCEVDDRKDYKEVREIAYGLSDERLYAVVFTQRGHEIRVISLRKANQREVKRYVEQT